MSALEQEIIERFSRLDASTKQRVLNVLTNDLHTSFDYDKWWAEVDHLQGNIRASGQQTTDILSLLDELREEAS